MGSSRFIVVSIDAFIDIVDAYESGKIDVYI